MTKKTKEELELEEYLAGLSEKKVRCSDNRILGVKLAYQNPELRKRQSELRKGVPLPDEHAESIRRARLNAPPRTEATRAKLSANSEGNSRRCKKIHTPHGVFNSLSEASAALNIRAGKIRHMTRDIRTSHEWYFLTKDKLDPDRKIEIPKIHAKPMVTPYGVFYSQKLAMAYCIENGLTTVGSAIKFIYTNKKNDPKSWYHISLEEYIMLTGKDPYNE